MDTKLGVHDRPWHSRCATGEPTPLPLGRDRLSMTAIRTVGVVIVR
jgi:hypothetical protein